MPDLTAQPAPARLRMPRSALLAVLVLAICVIPMAAVSPWLLALFVVPLLAGLYVWRSGVDIDRDGIAVHAALATTTVPWPDVAGVEVRDGGPLFLIRRDGGALRMPTLRARDLPRLHQASGGRLGVPPVDRSA